VSYQLNFEALTPYLSLILKGLAVTVGLTATSAILGTAFGIAGAAIARSHFAWARKLVTAYVELIRNTPFLVQMFFIFFGLPSLGVRLPAIEAAILAMTVNLTAYSIEIVRAGIDAVPRGQREAGLALGIRPRHVFIRIVLPQALANIYPALVSQIVITMLDSAVVSQIAVTDLTHMGNLIESRSFRAFETYIIITGIYLALAILIRRLLDRLGRPFLVGRIA
jgi:polar amino acid transport system permease protein